VIPHRREHVVDVAGSQSDERETGALVRYRGEHAEPGVREVARHVGYPRSVGQIDQ